MGGADQTRFAPSREWRRNFRGSKRTCGHGSNAPPKTWRKLASSTDNGSIDLPLEYGKKVTFVGSANAGYIVPSAAGVEFAASDIDLKSIIALADYDTDGFTDMGVTGDSHFS